MCYKDTCSFHIRVNRVVLIRYVWKRQYFYFINYFAPKRMQDEKTKTRKIEIAASSFYRDV